MVAIQTWRNEEAISKWRTNEKHQKSMQIGFDKIFKDYTLKVLSILRVYGKYDREQSSNEFKKSEIKKHYSHFTTKRNNNEFKLFGKCYKAI